MRNNRFRRASVFAVGAISASLLVFCASQARAQFLTTNYQPSQPTGYSGKNGPISTVGGNVTSKNFTDGTADGKTYTISALPFDGTDPAFEATPGNNTINYQNVLNNAFGTVDEFNYGAPFSGANEFTVQSYSVFASNGGGIGQDMYVVYKPSGESDPPIPATEAGSNLHWIQVIWNNWAYNFTTKVSTPGTVANVVDNLGAANPYYDTKGAAGLTTIGGDPVYNFYDSPTRSSAQLATYNFAANGPLQWMAEDFLVSDTGSQDANGKEIIDVYGGIEYGFQVTPEPSTIALLGFGAVGLLMRRRAKFWPC